MHPHDQILYDMDFPQRLAALRKEKGLTQQVLAEQAKISLVQLRRYEAGTSQPTLDAIKRLAIALSVSSDEIIFDTDERDPDEDLKLRFEAVTQFDEQHKEAAKTLLDGLILKYQAQKIAAMSTAGRKT